MRRRPLLCVPVALLLLALPAGALAQDPPVIDDAAVSLIASSIAATRQAASMHIAVTAAGSIPGGPDGAATVDDATMDADLDIANAALSARLSAPSLELSDFDLRIVDGSAYIKNDIMTETLAGLGTEGGGPWIKMESSTLVEFMLSAIPGGPRILGGEPDQARVERVLRKRLDKANASAAIADEQACAAGTCTRVHIEAPLQADASDLFGLFGGLGPVASPGPVASGTSVERAMTLDLLVDTETTRLDSVVLAQGSDESGLTVTVTMSAYDAPVTVEAPPADQITDWGLD